MSEATIEPEHIRWVNYACDCAERAMRLTNINYKETEPAIKAARAWANNPTEENKVACQEAKATIDRVVYATFANDRVAAHAAFAAAKAAEAAAVSTLDAAKYCATSAAEEVVDAVACIEEMWQTDRMTFYGLEVRP